MSLLSLLFGCHTKKPIAQVVDWPRFPETDRSDVQVVPVALDGFWAKGFFIPQDKQRVYVLGFRISNPRKVDLEDAADVERDALLRVHEQVDYRVFCLETTGRIQHQFDLPSTEASWGASFGVVDQQLFLRVSDGFLAVDPEKFAIREKIPVYDSQDFPSKQNIELMTIDEQRDAYQPLFDAQLTKGTDSKWLDWKPGGQYFVLATAPTGKRSAWSPMTYEDSLIADLKGRLGSIPVALNPKANDQRNGSELQISDESVQIRETDYLSAGTQLDYPNYKKRAVLQYEMKLGDQTFHFSTTDKDRHDLRIGFSDNLMLVTADGCAWVKYESVLYKISKK